MTGYIEKIRPYELTGTYLSDVVGLSRSAIYKYNEGSMRMPKDIFDKFIKIVRQEANKLIEYADELERIGVKDEAQL